MTEFLIGLLVGVAVCWAFLHVTEKLYERRPS
jgi:hypothetical protein